MQKVIPLTPGDQLPAVIDLIDALLFLAAKKKIDLPHNLTTYLKQIDAERDTKQYGETTQELVRLFQEQNMADIEVVKGTADEITVNRINTLLEELGALTTEQADGPLLRRRPVRLKPGMRDEKVKALQDDLKALGFEITDEEGFFGRSTRDMVHKFQEQNDLQTSDTVQEETTTAIKNALDAKNSVKTPPRRLKIDKTTLLALEKKADLSPLDLRADPETYKEVLLVAVNTLKAFLDDHFQESPEVLRQELDEERITDWIDGQKEPQEELLDLFEETIKEKLTEEEIERERNRINALDDVQMPQNPLDVDLPLKEHPLTQTFVREAKMHIIGDMATLSEEKTEKLLDKSPSLHHLNDEVLEKMVDEEIFDPDEVKRFGLAATLYQLFDEDTEIAQKVLAREDVTALKDLAKFDKVVWSELVGNEEGASIFAKRVGKLYPSETLQTRLSTSKDLEIKGLADLATIFQENNPERDLLSVDLSPDDEEQATFVLDGLSDKEQERLFEHLQARQRVFGFTREPEHAGILIEAGYGSAVEFAEDDPTTIARRSGLSEEVIRPYYERSRQILVKTSNDAIALIDAFRGGLELTTTYSLPPETPAYLKRLKSFEKYFGSQTYCHCEHCSSILSPSAYFVDMMYVVEKEILVPTFGDDNTEHDLHLKHRRPDLWDLELTCENTDTLVPTLDLINEILERHIDPDRQKVYSRLSKARDSFEQPFMLPLVKLQTYLQHFDVTRADIARLLEVDTEIQTRAVLGISKVESELITTSMTKDELEELYGLTDLILQDDTYKGFDVQELLRPIGLSRKEADELISSRFVTAEGVVTINAEKIDQESVQNDIERVYGLKPAHLDLIHRFTRLYKRVKKSEWSISELDMVLSLQDDPIDLETVVTILELQKELSLSVEKVCLLWKDFGTVSLDNKSKQLFERLFNGPPFSETSESLPRPDNSFLHPFLQTEVEEKKDKNELTRLCAGLGVSSEELYLLIKHLFPSDTYIEGFRLDHHNISTLYRHTLLARSLDVSIQKLFSLWKLQYADRIKIETLKDVKELLDIHRWWRKGYYTLEDIDYINNGGVSDEYGEIVKAVINNIKNAHLNEFSDTLFVFIPGVTEDDSRQIIKANPFFEKIDAKENTFTLTRRYAKSTGLVLDQYPHIDPRLAKELVDSYHVSELIPRELASAMDLPIEEVKVLIEMAGEDLYQQEYVALRPADIRRLVNKTLPLRRLFQHSVYDEKALRFIRDNSSLFAIDDFNLITLQSLQRLSVYRSFADTSDGLGHNDVDKQKDVEVLHDALRTMESGYLASLFDLQESFVGSMIKVLGTGTKDNRLETLQRISSSVEIAGLLGIDGDTMSLIVSDDHDELSLASDALLGAFRAKYEDENAWQEKVAPFEDHIRGYRRDALCDYLMYTHDRKRFTSRHRIYEYFLIDVELTGCARTSRLVAAISSLQLYIHRVLMNLEQGSDGTHGAPKDLQRFKDEWSWRKNYRVWEANRKVFLYPETYIEPELRDDKTPLFEELESTLLQQEINEQNVLDAYASYMAGFEEISNLKIAGSYHDMGLDSQGQRKDILHMIGATRTNTPTYYYRTASNVYISDQEYKNNEEGKIIWHPWKKIDAQIPDKKISPIIFKENLYIFWVDINTTQRNKFLNGYSIFEGYKHRLTYRYIRKKLDGTWTAPQNITLKDFKHLEKEIIVYETGVEANESHTLSGIKWEKVYPEDEYNYLTLCQNAIISPHQSNGNNNSNTIEKLENLIKTKEYNIYGLLDFYENSMSEKTRAEYDMNILDYFYGIYKRGLYEIYSPNQPVIKNKNLYAISEISQNYEITNLDVSNIPQKQILDFKSNEEIDIVNSRFNKSSCIIDLKYDTYYLSKISDRTSTFDHHYIKRFGTTIAESIIRKLISEGVDSLLDLDFQNTLKETQCVYTNKSEKDINKIPFIDKVPSGKIDFTGPYGTYYREIFFHIPFLIANHLNSQQKFKSAQRWYHYIFDLATDDTCAHNGNDQSKDCSWRYVEFYQHERKRLREMLTDDKELQVYKSDPFNPHAIARLRFTAYQKTIVMKYIDNLLDWGDKLFTEFTVESVNEATMLYVMASDILGERPTEIQDCGIQTKMKTNYKNIRPLIKEGYEVLIELEDYNLPKPLPKNASNYYLDASHIEKKMDIHLYDEYVDTEKHPLNLNAYNTLLPLWDGISINKNIYQNKSNLNAFPQSTASLSSFHSSLVRSFNPVFCFPVNKEFLAYWGRVNDRLNKIRNCEDIKGVKRHLDLFQPELDPRLLVRAKAIGLSVEDALKTTSGDLPPYRFEYLIEKAKGYIQTVQSFGNTLLGAMEKRDAEELSNLKLVHEQNIQKLTTTIKEMEIKAENENIETLSRQKLASEENIKHYERLINEGLSDWEFAQQTFMHISYFLGVLSAPLEKIAGTLGLLPNVGSPFAYKYGGTQLKDGTKHYANSFISMANDAKNIADSAGLIASNKRREEGWKHLLKMSEHELKQIDKKILVAEIKRDIVKKSLDLHKKAIEQTEEMFKLYKDKFSNLGLYTWLSKTLHGLYRDAYNSAFSMAKLAEQAFRFERDEETMVTLGSGSWDASKSGLLAGERLMISLQQMEQRYIETNYRKPEIDQSFSLHQIDPGALLNLKINGSCDFGIDELFFDLIYPGHYRRKIKAVRISIPCITGPYVNIGATLTLTKSQWRNEPHLKKGADVVPLLDVPLQRTVSIATSKAQNDAGVFEFNFHDQRYMPFEGAGAISTWNLSLPKNARQFDYQTISDVILHISYTAEEEMVQFRNAVEEQNATILEVIKDGNKQGLSRLFSFRHDFSYTFNQLLDQPVNTEVEFEIKNTHFPIFINADDIKIYHAALILNTIEGFESFSMNINIDQKTLLFSGFSKSDTRYGRLPYASYGPFDETTENEKKHIRLSRLSDDKPQKATISITDLGDLKLDEDDTHIDKKRLTDIYLYLQYRLEGESDGV